MSQEFEPTLDDAPIRQGDVFLWQGTAHYRPWNAYGVVVTADCDLAKEKTKGRVSYIPALIAEDYLWLFLRERRFLNEYQRAKERVQSIANKHLQRIGRTKDNISTDAVASWVLRVGAEKFPDEIEMTDPGQAAQCRENCNKLVAYHNVLDTEAPDISLLIRCLNFKNGNSSTAETLAKEFKGDFTSPPGDVFHLTTVDGQENGGLFLMLRHINQCDLKDIAIRTDQLRYGEANAKRIGRIAAPYRYALTQNLARVFADIGLPEEYDTRRQNASASFFAKT